MRIIFTVFMSCLAVYAEAQTSVDQLRSYMGNVRSGTYEPVPEAVLTDNTNEEALITVLNEYLSDSVSKMRSKSYDLIDRIGSKSTQASVKQQAINYLIGGIADVDSGISGLCSDALTNFEKDDFDEVQKNNIASYLNPATPHLDQVIKLSGYLDMNVVPQLQVLYGDRSLSNAERLAAQVSMIRLGDQGSNDGLLEKLSTVETNDDFVYDIVPELVFTRSKDVFDFLVQIVASDERDCFSANPNSESRILCGYRVMEYIAPAVINYPLPVDEDGELDVNNYRRALETVREWFVDNPNYELDRSSF